MDETGFGYFLLLLSYLLFFSTTYTLLWTKLFPPSLSTSSPSTFPLFSGFSVASVAADRYYSLVVPWTFSVAVLIFGFCSWLGMKFFRHN
jgi:hypothetical protein